MQMANKKERHSGRGHNKPKVGSDRPTPPPKLSDLGISKDPVGGAMPTRARDDRARFQSDRAVAPKKIIDDEKFAFQSLPSTSYRFPKNAKAQVEWA